MCKPTTTTNKDIKPLEQFDIAKASKSRIILMALGVTVGLLFEVWFFYQFDISYFDVAFCIGYTSYLVIINQYFFDWNSIARGRSKTTKQAIDLELIPGALNDSWFAIHMVVASIGGLLIPLGLLLLLSSTNTNLPMASHVFLLIYQILLENVMLSNSYVHDLVRLMIPIGFRFYGQQHLVNWFLTEYSRGTSNDDKENASSSSRLMLGLATFNVLFWTYNLFIVLLLRMVPNFMDNERSPIPTSSIQWTGVFPYKIAKDENRNIKLN